VVHLDKVHLVACRHLVRNGVPNQVDEADVIVVEHGNVDASLLHGGVAGCTVFPGAENDSQPASAKELKPPAADTWS
jgi:hypothetical protein